MTLASACADFFKARPGTLGVLALVVAWAAWGVWESESPAIAEHEQSASRVASFPPSFPDSGAANTATTLSVAELRARYRQMHDRHAAYEWLRTRSEPEAKYLAFRAVEDCQEAIGYGENGPRDWHDMEFQFREALANPEWSNHATPEVRKQAFDDLHTMCSGFLRPNSFPSNDTVATLLKDAIAGNSLPARANWRNWGSSHAERLGTVREVFASSDAMAYREAVLSVIGLRADFGAVLASADQGAMIRAVDIASCKLGNQGCGVDHPLTVSGCAFLGLCPTADSPYIQLIDGLEPADRDKALALANTLAEAVTQGRTDLLTR